MTCSRQTLYFRIGAIGVALLVVAATVVAVLLTFQAFNRQPACDDVNLSNKDTVSTKGFDVHTQNYHPKPLNTVGRPA
jgi:hypothetical protein